MPFLVVFVIAKHDLAVTAFGFATRNFKFLSPEQLDFQHQNLTMFLFFQKIQILHFKTFLLKETSYFLQLNLKSDIM